MARRKIREYDSKRLLSKHLDMYESKAVQVGPETDLSALEKENPHIKKGKLVVKPDMLFGKRGKSDLVLLGATWEEAEIFIKDRMGKEAQVGQVKGPITHFIIEPFIAHKEEYYLSILPSRDHDTINFSDMGGMDIEANWDKVAHIEVPIGTDPTEKDVLKMVSKLPKERQGAMASFILGAFKVYKQLDFTLLEFNPICFDGEGKVVPLDARGELDETAVFKQERRWGAIEFPRPFGRKLYEEERFISDLDSKSGSSLKLTLLNPEGRIWTMVAGGGASVIYTDTIVDLGMGKELANYGEYSGNPNTEETYLYAKTVIDLATKKADQGRRALIIGGGIANFTDVAATFKGIIQAIRECKDKMKKAGVRIYIRRGGPNYQAGLEMMRALGKETGIPIEVYGPETHMTKIVPMAMDYVRGA